MNTTGRKSVKVSDKELESIKKFFYENYGAKTECEKKGIASIPTIWRFMETGKARPEKVIAIRKFIKEYKPATI